MAIFCFGSINLDHIYRLPHLPRAGETVASVALATGVGGKGANQSVAAVRDGATVRHVGAVGPDGVAALRFLSAEGIDVTGVRVVAEATGHAVVMVDPSGENAIVLHPGANMSIDREDVEAGLAQISAGDTLLLQNETPLQDVAARIAVARGARVIYSAAPFSVEAVSRVLPLVSVLVMNEVEAAQLISALGTRPSVETVITKGARGAEWYSSDPADAAPSLQVEAFPARAIDTTGAGDCFVGVLSAALDAGKNPRLALARAAAAGALQVARPGASAAMPTTGEIDARLAG